WTPPHTLGGALGAAFFFPAVRTFPDSVRRATSSKIHLYQASSITDASDRRNAAMRVNDSKSSGASTVLLSIVAIGLAGMVGAIGLIHQVGELGPKVGDIVAFDPLDPISRDMRARLAAMPAGSQPAVACVLDVRAMHAGGGSVVIEAREPR